MYFCLVIAMLSTLLWINIMFADIINSRVNPYQKNNEDMLNDKRSAIIKTVLVIIMSIFWSAVLYF